MIPRLRLLVSRGTTRVVFGGGFREPDQSLWVVPRSRKTVLTSVIEVGRSHPRYIEQSMRKPCRCWTELALMERYGKQPSSTLAWAAAVWYLQAGPCRLPVQHGHARV